MPIWSDVKSWMPFSFDAAGLLTLLGVDEVNQAVGRLVRSTWLEYMPLLAPFVINSNRFTAKTGKFHFYDITMGNKSTDLAGWFARLITSHAENFEMIQSYVVITVLEKPQKHTAQRYCGLLVGFAFFGSLFSLAILSGDWWGLASSSGVLVSVLIRTILVEANRSSIDALVEEQLASSGQRHGDFKISKCILITEDNKAISITVPSVITKVLFFNPSIKRSHLYDLARYCGWPAFFIHVIAINIASFAVKVVTTVCLTVFTVLYSWKFGCSDSSWRLSFYRFYRLFRRDYRLPLLNHDVVIGSVLRLTFDEWPHDYEFVNREGLWRRRNFHIDTLDVARSQERQDLYAWLDMEEAEEESMAKWDLFPHTRGGGQSWWRSYVNKKMLIQGYAPIIAKEKACARVSLRLSLPSSVQEYSNEHIQTVHVADNFEPVGSVQRSDTGLSTTGLQGPDEVNELSHRPIRESASDIA